MRYDEDYTEFRMSLRVLGASYEHFIGDEHVGYYWSVLEDEPFTVIEALFDHLTRAEHAPGDKMPSAHQLRKMASAERSGSQYELPCQQPGCRALMPWPPVSEGEARFYCPRHAPEHGRPAQPEERQAVLAQLTPEGKAFLRTALPQLMLVIPISDVERKAAEAMEVLRRPVAFADKAEGPGVNTRVFLSNPFLTEGLSSDHANRRYIMRVAGWTFDQELATWRKGKRRLSDEDIDGFSTGALLAEYVGRGGRE